MMDTQQMLLSGLLGILLIATVIGAAGGTPPSGILTPKYTVSCSVAVTNVLFGDLRIDSASCAKGPSCFIDLPNVPAGFFSDKGKVILRASDASDMKPVDVVELTTTKVGVDICTGQTSGSIDLINENGALLQSKPWSVG